MALADKIPELLEHIKKNKKFTANNVESLEIYKGNLEPKVKEVLKSTLSSNYYSQIESRVVALNILQKLIDKLSTVYSTEPERVSDNPQVQEMIDFYSDKFDINSLMTRLEEYSNLHKGFSLEPFVHNGDAHLRCIPYDRFLPYTDDKVLDNKMSVYIKFLGKKSDGITNIYRAYDSEEWVEFTSDKEILGSDEHTQGEIPFQYETIEPEDLIPTADTDMISLTKIIPVVLTDLGGAIMFQCFTIIYGVDVAEADFRMSPNAFWDIKSDASNSDKGATVGTIKPEVDSDKVLEYVRQILTMWLESKGIKVGNAGSVDMSSMSGVSKILDEIDTVELRKQAMRFFEGMEDRFWHLMARTHNYWVENNLLDPSFDFRTSVPEEFDFTIAYPSPEIQVSAKDIVDMVKLQMDAGILSKFSAIKKVNPEMEDDAIMEELERIKLEQSVTIPFVKENNGKEIPKDIQGEDS